MFFFHFIDSGRWTDGGVGGKWTDGWTVGSKWVDE